MKRTRMSLRTRVMTLTACLLGLAVGTAAGGHPGPGRGHRLPQDRTARHRRRRPDKIEVVEFFSYMCPHCEHFYPMVSQWLAKLPKDVSFRRVPVGFERPQWVNLARAFYALQVHRGLRQARRHALHMRSTRRSCRCSTRAPLPTGSARTAATATSSPCAYGSFGVNNQTVQADRMAQDYGVDSVPMLAVAGKYMVMANAAVGEEQYLHELLAHADAVIAMARSELHPAASAATPAKPAKPAKPQKP